jgi:hypothetical protein
MMFKKSLHIFTSLLVVLGMLAAATPAFALVGTRHAKGKVVAINRRTHVMTVRTALGTRIKLRFNAVSTRLWHNRVRIALSRLHVGNTVDASFSPSASRGFSGTAGDVDDDMGFAEVSGTVAAVDTTVGTISIASHDGGSTVILNVDSTTVITRNGAPATLADLLFGDQVEAKYNSATMLASSIKVEDSTQASEVEGSVTAVDATAGTITISGEGDSNEDESMSPTVVTLNVTTSTVIMLDESPAPLSSLQVGMQAEAQYDPATMNASFIEAETQH